MKKKLIVFLGIFTLILTLTFGGTFAVFQADSEIATTSITTTSLDIALKGDTQQIKFQHLVPGQFIDKRMFVENTNTTTLYTRVTIKKYWLDEKNQKDYKLSAKNIQIQYDKSTWLEEYYDQENGEEIVLYYKTPLRQGQKTTDFLEGLVVPNNLGNTYQNKIFVLDIVVDAVQSIDGQNAILTQWGVLATINQSGSITKIDR